MVPECLNIPEPTAAFRVYAADGGVIVVRRHGNPDGPRLILSHGNGLAIDAYYPFWSLLANRFDLFIHDIRNHGWNPVGERHMHNIQLSSAILGVSSGTLIGASARKVTSVCFIHSRP